MEKEYTYYAFISYNHRDEKWAKMLQYKLHHYRLPSVARKEIGEDVRIRPVFRYVSNLSLGDLRSNLSKELEESKYLIVICSPNSAQPNIRGEHWVNDEINRFIALGRTDRIIPVIVAGTPNSGDVSTECFPPALRATDIAGADLSAGSRVERHDSFLKIVAKLLELKPDQLIRLTEREDRRRRIIKWLCIVPILLLGIIGGLFEIDANRTVKNYYADYVDSFGLPEGIFRLKPQDLMHRHVHYRFEYQGFQFGKSPHADSADWCFWKLFGLRRRLVRVVQANSHGKPIVGDTNLDRPLVQDFKYDNDSRLNEIRIGKLNSNRELSQIEKRIELFNETGITNGLLKFFANEGQFSVAGDVSSKPRLTDQPFPPKSEIAQHLVMRNDSGRVVQILFLNRSGTNVADNDGQFGFSYAVDDLGRKTLCWNLFRKGKSFVRRANKRGVAGCKYEYEGCNVRKIEYVDVAGRHIIGYYTERMEFDKYDNMIRNWSEDNYGEKAIGARGYAECRYEYDSCGNITRRKYFDVDGRPALDNEGIAEVQWENDANGNVTKTAYFDLRGNPTLCSNGVSVIRWECDACENVTRESYFDVDGRPTLSNDGVAEIRREYDACNNNTRVLFFGIDGKPSLCRDGYTECRIKYDASGHNTMLSYFDMDGKPTLSKDYIAEVHLEYDIFGNPTAEYFFGVDGKATMHKDGFVGILREYDGSGNVTKTILLGEDGELTLCKDGYAECRREYDARGNQTKVSYFDVDGEHTLHKDGIGVGLREYDDFSNVTKESYFGETSYSIRREYNDRSYMTKVSFFDDDENPMLCDEGYAECHYEYDECGNVTNKLFFGVDGSAIQSKGGGRRSKNRV